MGKKPKHGAYSSNKKSRYHKTWGWLPKDNWIMQTRADKVPQRSRLGRRQKSGKPFPKSRKFDGKTYHTPSFHSDKRAAQHTAKNYRSHGGSARVVKGKNILGDTRYAVYRKGGMAGTARRITRKRKR